jgi:hypothetical protein
VSVPAREQRAPDEIETILQAREARLASMFTLFTRLARDEGIPPTEELATRSPVAAQIGHQLGISQMHVRRLLAHALGYLRRRLLGLLEHRAAQGLQQPRRGAA